MAVGDIGYTGAISLVDNMTTDLDALAAGASNIGAVVLDNTVNGHHHLVAELVLASVDLSAATGLAVDLYAIPSPGGTNYVDAGTDASTTDLPPGTLFLGTFAIQKTSAAHRASIIVRDCLQMLKYKFAVVNRISVAFAATGNTLRIGTNSDKVLQA